MKEVGQMSEDKKPDWFELVDGDAPSAQVTKINKKLPAIAILAAGTVVALGSFFSSATESDAHATTSSIQNQSTESPGANLTSENSVSSSPTPAAAINDPSQGGVQAPGLDGDDEGDDHDFERRGHDGDGDDGEHERRGHDDEDRE
jgi:hypothetical protein